MGGLLITLNAGWSGQWPVMLLALALGTLLMVAIGLLLGSVLRTTMQVNTWSTVVLLVLIMPGVAAMVQMPAAIEAVFGVLPTNYLVGLLQMGMGAEIVPAQLALNAAVLAGFAAVVLGGVAWTLRRESA